MVQSREEKLAKDKEYREKNKEKRAAQQKDWREKNREANLAQKKAHYEANREELLAKQKAYHQSPEGKEKIKEWRETPEGKKSQRIRKWKSYGLICDDYSALYEKYVNTTNCENCDIELTIDRYNTSTTRCMDHSHETGLFRNVLCQSCNIKRG